LPNTIFCGIKWAELVDHVGEKKTACCVFRRKPEWNKPLTGARLRWEDDIEMDLENSDGKVWTAYICFRIGTSGGLFEWGNDSMGSIKRGETHD